MRAGRAGPGGGLGGNHAVGHSWTGGRQKGIRVVRSGGVGAAGRGAGTVGQGGEISSFSIWICKIFFRVVARELIPSPQCQDVWNDSDSSSGLVYLGRVVSQHEHFCALKFEVLTVQHYT